MKKQKKIYIATLILAILIILMPKTTLAKTTIDLEVEEYTDEYKEYLKLSEEEQKKIVPPRKYEVPKTKKVYTNPLKKARYISESYYSLRDVIPENLVVKSQGSTTICWAFSTIASLETNLALNNIGTEKRKKYDFSEKHMNYATTRIFADGAVNEKGFNRTTNMGGNWDIATAYLTNGFGAIDEKDMPFDENMDVTSIDKIQDKKVTSQVYDTIEFPSCKTEEDRMAIKEHIKNHGGVQASIHGANPYTEWYNQKTGAIFCDDKEKCKINHGVTIIGWDDNYDINNFNEKHRPKNKGAWIIKNSWGEDKGDRGLMFISYEDINIGYALYGFIKASDEIDYENIYQYDYVGRNAQTFIGAPIDSEEKIYMGNVFNKKTEGNEYITQVSLHAPDTYTCKVFINPNGKSMDERDLQQVELKAGETETFGVGYHTLEFLHPIQITKDEFAVVIEISGCRIMSVLAVPGPNFYEGVTEVPKGKCFATTADGFKENEWEDLTKRTDKGYPEDLITSIKAFTVSSVVDSTLKEIKITTPPNKTDYFVGENFKADGMVVTAYYNDGTSKAITDYSITGGTSVKEGQTGVTISYEDKTITQKITVQANTLIQIEIQTPPKKTQYIAGENFDKTGMVILAKYKNGETKIIDDYKIKDGANLKNAQTSVTIEYEGKTAIQAIKVETNTLKELQVEKQPDKTSYVVGQNFDKTGMKVIGIYQNGNKVEIIDYIIENGENLKEGQIEVTIKFEDKTITQKIKVESKKVEAILVKKMPSKIQYIQNKEELDLNGGSINVTYNDKTTEEILMTSDKLKVRGFNNKEIGKNTITLTYEDKNAEFEIEIIKEDIKDESVKNSDFSDIKGNVTNIQVHTFSDLNKQEYVIMQLEVNEIKRNLENDSCEYYYYLSTNQKEARIDNWIKIKEEQKDSTKLEFTIDTRDVANYKELSDSDVLYLYIKEKATKGGNQGVNISKAVSIELKKYIDVYKDDKKTDTIISDINTEVTTKDETTSKKNLPQTGVGISIIIIITVSAIGGMIEYIKYKKLSKYVK